MTLILADVGGTNVRFAAAQDGVIDGARIKRYQNDDFDSFDSALHSYLERAGVTGVEGLSVAVAGPVSGGAARLTNRGWSFNAAELGNSYGGKPVYLLNDLSALGYALDALSEDDTSLVLDGPVVASEQRLVIGAGTGFNVSPVLQSGGQTFCLRAEAGLSSLPTRVAEIMQAYIGGVAPWVRCAEDAVRGPGLSELHAAATGGPVRDARDVMAAAGEGDSDALASTEVYARMLGAFVQDLRLLYMPTGGIFLAGSVARGLLASPARDVFIQALGEQPTVKQTMAQVRVSLITRDEAALVGCLAYAGSMA